MVTIEIKLTNNQYGGCPWLSAVNEGKTEIIPSPVRIIRAILSGLYQSSYIKHNEFDYLDDTQISLFNRLVGIAPSYYIPQYAHGGSISYFPDYTTGLRNIVVSEKENQSSSRINFDPFIAVPEDDNSIFVFFDTTLSGAERSALTNALEYLTYLGRSEYGATWELMRSTKVKPNCTQGDWGEVVETINTDCEDLLGLLSTSPEQLKEDGYRSPPFMSVGFYRLNAIRDVKHSVSKSVGGQVAFLSIDPQLQIPKSQVLKVSNVLHKYLCLKAPCGQSFGTSEIDRSPIGYDEALHIIPDFNSEDFITGIRIVSMSPIDSNILLALKGLSQLDFSNGTKIPTRLLGVRQRTPVSSRYYRTVRPAQPQLEVRTSLKRLASSIFAKSVIKQLAHYSKKEVEIFFEEQEDGAIIASPSIDIGWVKVQSFKTDEDLPNIRGKRNTGDTSGYFVSIELQYAHDLIAIGDHFRFGHGELEAYQPK